MTLEHHIFKCHQQSQFYKRITTNGILHVQEITLKKLKGLQ